MDDFLRFRMKKISVFLCDKCYKALVQADTRAWEWFREYRDRLGEISNSPHTGREFVVLLEKRAVHERG